MYCPQHGLLQQSILSGTFLNGKAFEYRKIADLKGRYNMPSFANPLQGNVYRKTYIEELIQAIRLDIAGVLKAICVHDENVQATDIEIAKKVIADNRDVEKAHVGELTTLLRELDLTVAERIASGEKEVGGKHRELETVSAGSKGPKPKLRTWQLPASGK